MLQAEMQNAKSTSNKRVPIQGEGVECPLEDLVCEVGEGEEVEEPADASLLEEEKVALTAGPVVLDESGPYQTCRTAPIQVLDRLVFGKTVGKETSRQSCGNTRHRLYCPTCCRCLRKRY